MLLQSLLLLLRHCQQRPPCEQLLLLLLCCCCQAAFDVTAQALIREVWEVVDNSYMDARNSGFNHDKWLQLRDAALARTYYDQASVHRCVQGLSTALAQVVVET